ncbi:MAG TPA: dTDP-4-dehydrorhamnose reductase [Candidatus Cybelea sp.]|nr:dTDP-4-dehydrorhamnose reductase [Candidatus Cybelea sp.]
MKRVLLIGGSGQLGTAIARRWGDCEIAAPPHAELALEATDAVAAAIERTRPDVLVNAAAFHDVDRCEREPARAFDVNARAVGEVAQLAARTATVFVTLSTDYVFDGKKGTPYDERDAPNPLSVYGASRLAGEQAVAAANAPSFVVRTCGLYGVSRAARGRTPFIERVISQGAGGAAVEVVADVVASPTFAGSLADALRALVETRAYGLYHAAGAGAVSWYEFAREAVRRSGAGVALQAVAADRRTGAAIRPRFSALENAGLARVGIAMPSWKDGVAAYLAERGR